MLNRKTFLYLLVILLLANLAVGCNGNKKKPVDLPKPRDLQGSELDENFVVATMDYSVLLFKEVINNEENTMVSPLSIMTALAMTTNGADGKTKEEMENLLGGFSIDELNLYLYTYLQNIGSSQELDIANSIWAKKDSAIFKEGFLQSVSDYYNSDIFYEDFNEQTVKYINAWVNDNTKGMIPNIIDNLSEDDIMCLINALAFDASWKKVYSKADISEGIFTNIKGEKETVEFMYSDENLYIKNDKVTGFVKPYEEDNFSFVALLPNEGVSIIDYVNSLSGKELIQLINNADYAPVNACLPKFSYETNLDMNEVLKAMGMEIAFDKDYADFTNLFDLVQGNAYISKVIHKTFISVDELGTKAGATTEIDISVTSAPIELFNVYLDRPFIYMIVDVKLGLPVFIGTVMTINK